MMTKEQVLEKQIERMETENKRLRGQHVALDKTCDSLKAHISLYEKASINHCRVNNKLMAENAEIRDENAEIRDENAELRRHTDCRAGTLTVEKAAKKILNLTTCESSKGVRWTNQREFGTAHECETAVADIIRQVQPASGEFTFAEAQSLTRQIQQPCMLVATIFDDRQDDGISWTLYRRAIDGGEMRATLPPAAFRDKLIELARPKPVESETVLVAFPLTWVQAKAAKSVTHATDLGREVTFACRAALNAKAAKERLP